MQADVQSPFGVNQVQVRYDGETHLRAVADSGVYNFDKTLQRRLQRMQWLTAVELVEKYSSDLVIDHPDAERVLAERQAEREKSVEATEAAKAADSQPDEKVVRESETKTEKAKPAEVAKSTSAKKPSKIEK